MLLTAGHLLALCVGMSLCEMSDILLSDMVLGFADAVLVKRNSTPSLFNTTLMLWVCFYCSSVCRVQTMLIFAMTDTFTF